MYLTDWLNTIIPAVALLLLVGEDRLRVFKVREKLQLCWNMGDFNANGSLSSA